MFCCVYFESLWVAFWYAKLYYLGWINKECNLEGGYMGTWRCEMWFAFFCCCLKRAKNTSMEYLITNLKRLVHIVLCEYVCISKVTCLGLLICCIVVRCILSGIINVYQPWTSLINGRTNSLNEMYVVQINWFEGIANLCQFKVEGVCEKWKTLNGILLT